MNIRIKSVVFKKNGRYTVFSKIYNIENKNEPSHLDLVTKAISKGFSDNNFIALSTSTWNPFTIDIFPKSKNEYFIEKLIKNSIEKKLKKFGIGFYISGYER